MSRYKLESPKVSLTMSGDRKTVGRVASAIARSTGADVVCTPIAAAPKRRRRKAAATPRRKKTAAKPRRRKKIAAKPRRRRKVAVPRAKPRRKRATRRVAKRTSSKRGKRGRRRS